MLSHKHLSLGSCCIFIWLACQYRDDFTRSEVGDAIHTRRKKTGVLMRNRICIVNPHWLSLCAALKYNRSGTHLKESRFFQKLPRTETRIHSCLEPNEHQKVNVGGKYQIHFSVPMQLFPLFCALLRCFWFLDTRQGGRSLLILAFFKYSSYCKLKLGHSKPRTNISFKAINRSSLERKGCSRY